MPLPTPISELAGVEIISRKEAKARGLTRYFTGKPCKHGHIAERDTGAGRCVECNRNWARAEDKGIKAKRTRRYYASNIEVCREKARDYSKTDKARKVQQLYRKKHPKKRRILQKAWREQNPDYAAEHREANRGKYQSYCASRRNRMDKVVATTIEQMMIDNIYADCAALNAEAGFIRFHVHHKWPVSKGGPHLPWNLVVITQEENNRIGNQVCPL